MPENQSFGDDLLMTDTDLLQALTRDKENYTEEFLGTIKQEMINRKLDRFELMNRVKVGLNDAEPQICTIDQALAKFKQEIALWEIWNFINAVNEQLLLQKEISFWTAHYLDDGEYQQSFFIKASKDAEDFLTHFLRIEDAKPVVLEYDLGACEVSSKSKSVRYLQKISAELVAAEIPHTIGTASLSYFNAYTGARDEVGEFSQVLVPAEFLEAANDIGTSVDNQTQELYEQVEAFSEGNDESKLLECYNELAQIVDDASVFYNRGVLLFDRGQYEAAADSFIEAASLPPDGSEEFLHDVESYLQQTLEKTPKNTAILHCLASIAGSKDDEVTAEECYKKIVAIDPTDSIAHVTLGHLYYQNPRDNTLAYRHFKKYLELQPEAPDREAIERILTEL